MKGRTALPAIERAEHRRRGQPVDEREWTTDEQRNSALARSAAPDRGTVKSILPVGALLAAVALATTVALAAPLGSAGAGEPAPSASEEQTGSQDADPATDAPDTDEDSATTDEEPATTDEECDHRRGAGHHRAGVAVGITAVVPAAHRRPAGGSRTAGPRAGGRAATGS